MKSLSLTEMVYKSLRQYIIMGRWPAGTRLKETDLSEILHVSRTPIRAALLSLHHEGLLDYTPNVGYSVSVLNAKNIEEIYLIRAALERLATIQAMHNMGADDFAELKDIIASSERAAAAGDGAALIEFSTLFNSRMAELADMPRLYKLQADLSDYLLRLRNISFGDSRFDRGDRAVAEHKAIVAAMEAGDEERVNALIDRHLEHSRNFIMQNFKRIEDDETPTR